MGRMRGLGKGGMLGMWNNQGYKDKDEMENTGNMGNMGTSGLVTAPAHRGLKHKHTLYLGGKCGIRVQG